MARDIPERQDLAVNRQGTYANESEIAPDDRALLETPTGELAGRDPADIEDDTLAADDDIAMDVGAVPMSEITADVPDDGYGETIDGLSDIEEAVRQQAEDRALGDDEDYLA